MGNDDSKEIAILRTSVKSVGFSHCVTINMSAQLGVVLVMLWFLTTNVI